jgi:hypothetical protein
LPSFSQSAREDIYTDFVLASKRMALSKDLHERTIGKTFALPLDSNSEDKYESACWSISQFLFDGPQVERGLEKMISKYDSLQYDSKRALLEALYAVFPHKYVQAVKDIMGNENDPKLFSMCAVYLYRNNSSANNSNFLRTKMAKKFPGYDTICIVNELEKYLSHHHSWSLEKSPFIPALFRYQKTLGQKVIYSFQRWNRDYSGMAIIQWADGSFARNPNGKLMVFEQLARSGSDLPYFLTNGSTPQGAYSIQGIDVANNFFIGPTPNIQMIMPFEDKWEKFFQNQWKPYQDSLELYQLLFPASWRNYEPIMESWYAGKCGRTEIIAHGTTLDPEYFKGKPFYPLTPTLGCLCAKEIWNPLNGHLLQSAQFDLVHTFTSTGDNKGYLYVINVDNQPKAMTRAEIENWVNTFESGK